MQRYQVRRTKLMIRRLVHPASEQGKQNVSHDIGRTKISEIGMVKGNATQWSQGRLEEARAEECVGGVCPEDEEWVVGHARKERKLMMID